MKTCILCKKLKVDRVIFESFVVRKEFQNHLKIPVLYFFKNLFWYSRSLFWLTEGCYTPWKIDSTCYNEEFEENCYMVGDFVLSLSCRVIFIEMNGGTDENYTGPNNM